MIHDVVITPLKQIVDDRGKVMHMLRRDTKLFDGFGEIYFSFVNSLAVKAWKLHRRLTMNLAVPFGIIKLVLYDERKNSRTKGKIHEIIIGEEDYCLVTVPPGIWNGFQGLGTTRSLIANCATLPHDPNEVERLDIDDLRIPYMWQTE